AKMLIQLTPEYFAYYKKDFHPSQKDYGHMVDYWKSYLADEYQMASFQEEKNPRPS
ncbi:TPA: metal-dependent hydrolase, partial [Acinetobacter baumannii]